MFNISRRELIMLVLILALGLGLFATFYNRVLSPKPEIAFKLDDTPSVSVMASAQDPREIMVYVTGAVKAPGVYTLKEGSRIKDAIEIAGGALPEADLVRLNLAQRLSDEDKLYVFSEGENADLNGNSIDVGATAGITSPDDGKVNINTADKTTLGTLPGVGEVTSQKIIDYREKNGPFKAIEDIKKISGIGDKKFEQLQDKIKVR